jgi:uncharacterized protein
MNILKKILTFTSAIFISTIAIAQDKPLFELPAPNSLVYDNINFFSPEDKEYLNNKLIALDKETSVQIVVAITPEMYGYEKDDYATRLLESWKPGAKGKDNGFVILIKPKTDDSKGDVFIATGYGVEQFVTDAISKKIIDNEVIPEFKKGNYTAGIDKAINTIISLTKGEFTGKEYLDKNNADEAPWFIFIVFIIILITIIFAGRKGNNNHTSIGGGGLGSAVPWLLMGSAMGRSSSGGFGGFSSGSGGFGGFGGGMGGGGGAGGSW